MKIKNLLTTLTLVAIFLFVGKVGWGQTTYTWNVASGDWNTATNWTPNGIPGSSDYVVFDGSTIATATVTSIPNQVTVAKFNIINNANVTFSSGTAFACSGTIARSSTTITGTGTDFSTELSVGDLLYTGTGSNFSDVTAITSGTSLSTFQSGTIAAGTAFKRVAKLTITSSNGFSVEAGSTLTLSGSTGTPVYFYLANGATGTINGNLTFTSGNNRINAADASAISFKSGSIFTASSSMVGNAFTGGNTSSVVVFESGSKYICQGGSNPFAQTAPASKVIFQTGSTFVMATNSSPSLSGRTYANFEIDLAGFSQTAMTGSGALTIDNLTITSATKAYFNLTGGITINGDISVAAGDVAFYPVSNCDITFNGTNPQTISVTGGTLKFGAKTNFVLNQSIIANTTIDVIGNIDIKDKTISGTGTLNIAPAFLLNTTGNTTSGNKNITNVPSIAGVVPGMVVTGAGIAANTVVVSVSGTGPYTIAVNNNATATATDAAIAISEPASTVTCSSSYGLSSTNNVTISNKSFDSGATYIYNGTVSQVTGDILSSSLANLTIDNASGVTLSNSTSVTGDLNLINGKVILGNNGLTVNNLTGSSSSNYIVTNGTGMLKLATNGTSSVLYPVGSSASSYTPVVSTNNTSGDFLSLKVSNSISNATLSNESCVKLEWTASEVTPGGNDGTVTFQWNTADQGSSFDPSKPVYFGVWNGTKYDVELVNVTGTNPYSVSMNAPSTYPTTPVVFGNAEAFFPPAPALTADASLNNVDNNIEITFTDDATWRAAITAVKDGANALTVTTDYTVAAGVLTLIPNSGNSLKTSGSRTITVVATGYTDGTVTQVINAGAINVANSTLSNTPALTSVEKTTTVTATAKDQFNNLIEGYVFKYDVTTTDGSATTDESYTVAGTAYTANATDVALTATNASGIATFDIVLPATIDGGDGVSVQVQLNDGTTNFKTAIGYLAPVDPAATISPASIAEHSLNNFDVNIEIQNATFAASLDKVNYILNNAPAGLTVASIARTDDTHAKLTLAYDDAGNDFDANITNFNVTVKVAELVGASADVTSNSITLTAEVEVAPTVTIADAISTLAETTAAWAGEATATGGEAITEKGICWGTTTAPTVAGNKTTEGAGLGVITGSMTGLSANTTYYVRAYATNSIGTSYSATEKTFVTYSAEPTNHVNNFAVTPNSTNLDVSWSNNQGAVAATHYLIKASTSNNITDPTDFATIPSENLVIGSNNGVKVVDAATTSFSWSGLTANTQYFFKVYPFTKNANNLPNYKVDAAPAANATTNAAPKVETFVNFPETSTSYNTGTFVGVDGSTWSYVKCAGGSTTQIIAPSPVLGRNQSPISEVRSGTIQGGISTLGFKYMQAFSTAVSLDVFVNDTKVATVTTLSTESAVVKTVTEIPVYITGDFTIKFIQSNSSAGQVVIDDITWSSYAPTNPVVAVPVFSPGAGTYIGTQSVTLTSTTDGASIYYTTDGTTPSDASTLYTTPISLSASSTVKARAYKAGMDPSPVVSAVYVIQQPIEVANIAALRAGLTDGTAVYKLTGEAVLTFQHTTRNQKYIQDQTGGILIDDASGVITTTYNQYDGITGITGRMSLYGGLIQFTPVFNTAAASSTGNTITPQVVTLTELNTNFINYESELIKVESVTFTTTGTFVASQNLTIASGGVNSIFRTSFSTADYIGTNIPTNAKNIIGIAGHFNGAAQITARNLADFSNLTGIGDNAFSNLNAYPNPFSNEIRFEGADVARVTVTSIIGQVVLDRAIAGENYINTQELIRGIYLVKFTNKKGESILRKLIKE